VRDTRPSASATSGIEKASSVAIFSMRRGAVSARHFRSRRVGGEVADHRLGLEKLLEPELAELAAIARLLVAAEGRVEVEPARVDEHAAGPNPAHDRLRHCRIT